MRQRFIGLEVAYTGMEAMHFNVPLWGTTKPPPTHARFPHVGDTSMPLVLHLNPKTLHFIAATSPAFNRRDPNPLREHVTKRRRTTILAIEP